MAHRRPGNTAAQATVRRGDTTADLRRANSPLQQKLDECRAELDAALAREAATAEILGVVSSSPGALQPVFNAILEKAHALCGASRGTLFLFDGEAFRAAASQGYPEGLPERPRAIEVSDDPRLAALVAGERLIHVPDLTQLDDPIARAVAARGGVRTNRALRHNPALGRRALGAQPRSDCSTRRPPAPSPGAAACAPT